MDYETFEKFMALYKAKEHQASLQSAKSVNWPITQEMEDAAEAQVAARTVELEEHLASL